MPTRTKKKDQKKYNNQQRFDFSNIEHPQNDPWTARALNVDIQETNKTKKNETTAKIESNPVDQNDPISARYAASLK